MSSVRIAMAAFAGMIVSSPAIYSVNPLLLTPMAKDFGWGRGTLTSVYAVTAPLTAILFLVAGTLFDRFGVRRLLLACYVLFGCAVASLSLLDGSLLQFMAIRSLVAAVGTAITGVAYGKVVSHYFTTNRGLMLGLCLGVGGGLGMTIMPLIGGEIFAHYGWRGTYVGLGLIAIVCGLPAALALPRDDHAAKAATGATLPGGLSAREAFRSPAFLILLAMTLIACVAINGSFAHLAAVMTDAGLSSSDAAIGLSVYAASLMCAQFGIGWLLDRLPSSRLATLIFLVPLVGFYLLYSGTTKPILFLSAALLGAASGSEFGMLPYFLPRFFGLRVFGTLYGFIYAAAMLGTGIGPYLIGLSFDGSGSYGQAMILCEAGGLLTIAIMAALPPYRFTATGEEVGDPIGPATVRPEGAA
jgi:MFS family permease